MRRIASLAVLAIPLMSVLVGCDDDAPPVASGDTVAVGSLPGELSAADTTELTDTTDSSDTTEHAETTKPTDSSASVETSEPEPSAVATTSEPGRTSFGDVFGGGQPPDAQTVSDDTGRLRLAVPRAWRDRRTTPANGTDGDDMPSLSAAPDLAAFLDGYGTPGLTALVVEDDPDEALDVYDFREDCVADGVADYRAEDAEGVYDIWRDCGGTDSAIVAVAVRPDGADDTVLLLAQIVDPADAAALDHAVATVTLHD